MNYTIITDSLIVGSQPQKPEDIVHLKAEENVAYILCLQQDKDIEYWGIDFQSIVKTCKEVGILHMRRPVSHFLPFSHYLKGKSELMDACYIVQPSCRLSSSFPCFLTSCT